MKRRKLFVAILLPEKTLQELFSIKESNKDIDGVNWIRKGNLHITLFFIGFADEEKIGPIKEEIFKLQLFIPAFTIFFESIKLAPKQRPKMVWAQFQRNQEFQKFHDLAFASIKQIIPELNPPHKEPIPHVTLARIKSKKINQLDLSNSIEPFSINVNEFYLMESVSGPEGVRYFPLEKFKLDAH